MGLINDHRLQGARQQGSPNFDDRIDIEDIRLIVVHGISLPRGHFGGPYIEALFRNTLELGCHPDFTGLADLHVSSHLLIRRGGEIVQFVSFDKRAWHAGDSCYQGVRNCNDFAIGIELEGTDNSPYNPIQYSVLATTCRTLIDHYPRLSDRAIVGHSDVAPGRKSDPGAAFDWDRLVTLLRGA